MHVDKPTEEPSSFLLPDQANDPPDRFGAHEKTPGCAPRIGPVLANKSLYRIQKSMLSAGNLQKSVESLAGSLARTLSAGKGSAKVTVPS